MAHAKRVLITGAYGLIGNTVYRALSAAPDAYDVYGLARRQHPSDRLPGSELCAIPDDRLFIANLSDVAALQKAVQGMDVVVHMAANPNGEAEWESILTDNIIGTYNVFEACRQAGVKRIVSASSMQVIHGYRLDEPYKSLMDGTFTRFAPDSFARLTTTQPPRPMNLYGASKVWGEALAHMYAYAHGMSCICLRIAWVLAEEPPPDIDARVHWCSRRDVAQLVQRSVDAPDSVRFDVFFGLSDSDYNIGDIQDARDVLGYQPQDGVRRAR